MSYSPPQKTTILVSEPGNLALEVSLQSDGDVDRSILINSIPGTSDVQITSLDGADVNLRMSADDSPRLEDALELVQDWQRAERRSIEGIAEYQPDMP